jgi:hypothetical protein
MLVRPGDRAEHQVGNPRVAGRGHDGTALGHLSVHPGLERGRERKHRSSAVHRRTERAAVVKRADHDLDAAFPQALHRRLAEPAHHRAYPGLARQQRAGDRPALPTGGAQHQNR